MYKNVVVGFDGTEQARDALALARRLAAEDAKITAACVSPAHATVRAGNVAEPMREAADDALEEARGDARVDNSIVIEARTVPHGLHELAVESDADLLVLGSSRHGAAGTVTAGGVGRALLHGAPCPVAVAPNGYASADSSRPATVGVAFDGSDESLHALHEATALADRLGDDVQLVCVIPPFEVLTQDVRFYPHHTEAEVEAYSREEMNRLIDDAPIPQNLRDKAIITEGRPSDELAAAASEFEVLVMGSRGYGPVRRVLAGSTASAVLKSAAAAVLVVSRGARVPSETESASGLAT